MKTLLLTIATVITFSGSTVLAYERHEERVAYAGDRRDSLERHVNHLNRMLEHVRWQARHYRGDWRIRREVENISREVDRLNHRFRSGDYSGWRLRREVDRLHDRLHGIEDRLHVRSGDVYRWD